MSVIHLESLKGINDLSLVWNTLPFDITTVQLRIDFLNRYNSFVRAYRVVNQDVLATLTYRQDGGYAPLITLDPSSIDEQQGWTSYIEVNPNAASGIGLLEVDLVTRENAQKKLQRGQIGR